MARHIFYIYTWHIIHLFCVGKPLDFYTLVANIQYNTEYCENNILYIPSLYAV